MQPAEQHDSEMSVTRGSSFRGVAAADTAAFADVAKTSRGLPMFFSKRLIDLQYIWPWPSARLWNLTHAGHVKDGGVWHYGEDVEQYLENFIEMRHPSYSSAWDVACNLGIFLERLAVKHPNRQFYGSDISTVMVNATKKRCPSCVAEVFDVNEMQWPQFRPVPGHFPQPVDIVIVADVLYYMAWGGWPPLMNYALPTSWTRMNRQTFWQNLKSLARKEVIISHHGNSAVTQYLEEMGATWLAEHGVWVTPGMAGKAQIEVEHHTSAGILVGIPQLTARSVFVYLGLLLLCALVCCYMACAIHNLATSERHASSSKLACATNYRVIDI